MNVYLAALAACLGAQDMRPLCPRCGLVTPCSCCRLFRGSLRNGYGQVPFGVQKFKDSGAKNGRVRIGLHRWVMSQLIGRDLLPSEVVMHLCDQPACFFTEHLLLGSQAENLADARRKKRLIPQPQRGEANGRAVLSESDVVEIRRLRSTGVYLKDLARQFGVSISTIYDATSGRRWKCVGGDAP